jgi:hypothetical protein
MRKITESTTRPGSGCFALNRSPLEWIGCRERFHSLYTTWKSGGMDGFFFSHSPNEEANVIAFLNKTETILLTDQSSIEETNRWYATWFNPSAFWLENQMRRSVLTIFIRAALGRGNNIKAGIPYDPIKNNYEECLYSSPYVKQTKQAVMRFLFGCTCFDDPGNPNIGWVSVFTRMEPPQLLKRLKSPEKSDLSIIGAGSIWR